MARFGTVNEVLGHLEKLAKDKAPGEWIVVRNFDPSIQIGPRCADVQRTERGFNTTSDLLLNASGHLAYANSKAFEVAGIPKDVKNPPGAEFVRDKDGELTGVIKNNVAFLQILSKYPALTQANPTEALIGLLGKWSQYGLTTVSELSLVGLSQSPADLTVMLDAARSDRLAARIRAYPFLLHR